MINLFKILVKTEWIIKKDNLPGKPTFGFGGNGKWQNFSIWLPQKV